MLQINLVIFEYYWWLEAYRLRGKGFDAFRTALLGGARKSLSKSATLHKIGNCANFGNDGDVSLKTKRGW